MLAKHFVLNRLNEINIMLEEDPSTAYFHIINLNFTLKSLWPQFADEMVDREIEIEQEVQERDHYDVDRIQSFIDFLLGCYNQTN